MTARSERHWLRPEWHVTRWGEFAMGSPYPPLADQPVRGGPPDPWLCTECGADINLSSGVTIDGAEWCGDCAHALFDAQEANYRATTSPTRRLWDRLSEWLDVRLHNAYWSYCRRFGRQVVYPAGD